MKKGTITKKLICSALVFVLAAGLIGCGGEKKAKGSQEETSAMAEDPVPIEEEVITAEYEDLPSDSVSFNPNVEDLTQEYHIEAIADLADSSYTLSVSQQEKSYEDEEGKIKVEVSYETLSAEHSGEEISAIIDTYNQTAESDADFFIEYTKSHLYEFPSEFTNRYSVHTEIKRADDRILSIVKAENTEFAGAAPHTEYKTYNYNIATGKQMKLKNIIHETDLFAGKIAEKLLTENPDTHYFAIEETDGTMEDNLPALTKEIATNLTHATENISDNTEDFWYLDSEGIGFIFDSYEIAPQEDGAQEVHFSYNELQTVLDEAETAQTMADMEQDSHITIGNMEIYYVDEDVRMTEDYVGDIFASGLFYMEGSFNETKGLIAFTTDQTLTWDLHSIEEADAFLKSIQEESGFLSSEWEECGDYYVKKSILYVYNEPPAVQDPSIVLKGYREASVQISAIPKSSDSEPIIYTAKISVVGSTEEESYAPKRTTFTSITEAMKSLLPECSLIPDDYTETISELRHVYYYGTLETDIAKLDPEKVRRNQWVTDTFGGSMDGSTSRSFANLTRNEVEEYLLWKNDPESYEEKMKEMKTASGQIPDDIAAIEARSLIVTQLDWIKYAHELNQDITGERSCRYTYEEGFDEINQNDAMTRVEGFTTTQQSSTEFDSFVILQPDYEYDESSDMYLPTEMKVAGSRERILHYEKNDYLQSSDIGGTDKPNRNDDIHGTLKDFDSHHYRYTINEETNQVTAYDYFYHVSEYMGNGAEYMLSSECEYDRNGFLTEEKIEYLSSDGDSSEMSRKYTYNKDGLLESVEETSFGTTRTWVFSYEDNRLKEIHDKDYPNQLVYSFEYDNAGRLIRSTLIYDKEHDPEIEMAGLALNWETHKYYY